MSSPPREQLVVWRLFFETALAVIDVLDGELEREQGLPFRWYDVLVHLEEAGGAARMTELATQILTSKSGLTRVIDRMEEDGLVQRERPAGDRRVILVSATAKGRDALESARAVHRRGIDEHFLRHLNERDLAALARIFGKLREHLDPLRPGRIHT